MIGERGRVTRGFLPGEYQRGKDEVGGSSVVKMRVGWFDEMGLLKK